MGQIIKEQTIERDESNGGGQVHQKCEYNSTSEWIKIEINGETISLPVFEWKMLLDLINECLEVKGHSF